MALNPNASKLLSHILAISRNVISWCIRPAGKCRARTLNQFLKTIAFFLEENGMWLKCAEILLVHCTKCRGLESYSRTVMKFITNDSFEVFSRDLEYEWFHNIFQPKVLRVRLETLSSALLLHELSKISGPFHQSGLLLLRHMNENCSVFRNSWGNCAYIVANSSLCLHRIRRRGFF